MSIDKMADKAFMEYSMEVIKQRALPAIEDGCKPIHRRILYGMKVGGYTSNKPTRKSAKIVGEILGRFHPHGDSSVYDAMTRLSQDWKIRYPLVEMQGNNGTILGDKQAAARYTECRLTQIGELMTKDLDENIVPMELNYSGEEYEPIVLPSEFPNSLVNPNLGIAVGMSSTTVSHNLTEVCDAIIAYIKSKGQITTEEILKYIKGPDFPTGGIIINGEDIPTIYANGKGTIKVRSKYKVETINNKPTIIISEVPYLVSIEDKIIDKIKKMVTEDGYQDIDNVTNHTGNTGFEIRITCARNANVNKVIKDLCEKTGFQSNININNTILVNELPKTLSFKEMIGEYVKFRDIILKRIATRNHETAQRKIHILNGLLIAIADIDNIIQMIKSSKNKDDARQKLIAKYEFSLAQANAILDMKLSKLTKLEENDLQSEKGELERYAKEQEEIIKNTNGARDNLFLEQITNIKNKFGDRRRTEIKYAEEISNATEAEDLLYIVLNNNTIMPLKLEDKIILNKKGNILTKQGIAFAYIGQNIGKSFVFNKSGKIYTINNNELTTGVENPLIVDDSATCAITKFEKDFVITVTKKGVVKKSKVDEYKKITRSTTVAKIREDDELVYVGCAYKKDNLLLLGANGGLIKIKVEDINTTGRATIGSKGIDDTVICATVAAESDLIFTASDGKGKFTICEDFNHTAKGGKGQTITENTSIIAAISNTFFIIEKDSKITRMDKNSLAIKGKTATGAKISNEQKLKIAY